MASTLMYFRDKTAMFFSFLFPIIFLVIFGFISQNDSITINIAYINQSNTGVSQAFDQALSAQIIDNRLGDEANEVRMFKNDNEVQNVLSEEGYDSARVLIEEKLNQGDLAAAILVPEDFGEKNEGHIVLLVDASNQFAGVVEDAVSGILGEFNLEVVARTIDGEVPKPYTHSSESVQPSDLGGVDFVIPGIIAFSVMSLGLFSVSQAFVSYKSSGALRRLQTAPLNPLQFLVAQSITRLLMTALNVLIMVVIAVVLFDFNIRGTLIEFVIFGTLGAVMFLGMGFAIAGWAKNENQAAPITNIIFFPLMFLSGIFFPIEMLPDWLRPVAEILPPAFLADGLREIANNAQHIWELGPQLAGIAIWTIIVYFIAVKIFRWE